MRKALQRLQQPHHDIIYGLIDWRIEAPCAVISQ
jgi:hypothetical protein